MRWIQLKFNLFFLLGLIFTLGSGLEAQSVKLIGSRIIIAASSVDEGDPRAIFNPVTQQFFVSWLRIDQTAYSIRGRFINADGTKSRSKRYTSAGFLNQGAVSYSSTDNHYVINYEFEAGKDTKILDSAGKILDTNHLGRANSIAYSPNRNTFLFLYGSLAFLEVNSDATLLRAVQYPSNDSIYRDFAVADALSPDYFVVAQEEITNAAYFYRVSSNGIITGSRKRIPSIGATDYIRNLAFNPIRSEILIVFWRLSNNNFYTVRLNLAGTILKTRFVASGGTGAYSDISNTGLAFSNGRYYLTYDRDSKIYVKVLGALGGAASKEVEIGSGLEGAAISSAKPVNLFLIYWVARSNNSFNIYGQFIQVD